MPGESTPGGPLRERPSTGRRRAAAGWLSLCLVCVAAQAAADDNRSWSFEVAELREVNERHTVIRLRPVPPGRRFPRSCRELVLHAGFDRRQMTPRQRSFLDRRGHDEAIRVLREAELTNELVRLGSIDTGFGAMKDRPRKRSDLRCWIATFAFKIGLVNCFVTI